jgi:tetrahydromethanopterin S-methyltransferase subunit B
MAKDLDESVDKLEAAVDPNTVISIGGYNFTPAKLMIAGGIVSSVLGGLYGAFEVYKDYMDMKAQIQEYVAPDLSAINERITKLEQKIENAEVMVTETNDYVGEIRTDLKNDIRDVQAIVDAADRRNRELERDVLTSVRTIDREIDVKVKELDRKVDDKIQKALDNPLAN